MIQLCVATASMSLFLMGCHQPTATQKGSMQEVDVNQQEVLQEKRREENALSAKVNSERNIAAIERRIETAPSSVVTIRLLEGDIQVSEAQLAAGNIEFIINNETTQPLLVQMVKTGLSPDAIRLAEGRIQDRQKEGEVVTNLHKVPIKPGAQAVRLETVRPGNYKLLVTAPNENKLIAVSELAVLGAG